MPWEQLAILVIIGLISFVNWVMQKSAEHKEARRLQERIDRGELEASAEDDDYGGEAERAYEAEEQRRRFMEALGLPSDDPEPRPQPTQREPVVEAAPSVHGRARNFLHKLSGDLERRLIPEEVAPVVPPPIVSRPAPVSNRRHRSAKTVAAPLAPGGQLEFLSEPGGLRKAVLAQEVLGRCKGLSFDL